MPDYEKEMSNDLSIDLSKLHIEWRDFPEIFDKWGKRLAIATFNRDTAKDKLALVKSELDFDVRTAPGEFGIEKLTESAVTAAVTQELKYKKAQTALNEAQRDVNRLTTGLRALSGKKAALQDEVRLYLGSYFSEPVIDDEDFERQIADRATDATRPKLTRRKKGKK